MVDIKSGVTPGNVAVFADVFGNIKDGGAPFALPEGSVTSVSVVTAHGISGSVATPTSTPAITLTLGAITPSSVNASGTVAGSNLSGTNTGDQTITLTGGVTGSGTGTFATTLTNSSVTGQALTGFVSGAGTVSPSDTILTAVEKINGNTALLTGAVIYQGTWDANTNTPTLASGVGTKGFLYKVSVAGTTTIDGVSSWNAGDSIVFDGTVWDKIDGQATEVISVAGRTGVVTLSQTDVSGTVPTSTTVNGHALSSNVVVSASDITTGTLPAAQLPNPTASTLGGVESYVAVTHQWINAISTSGVPSSSQPTAADISGLATSATTDTTNATNISSGTLGAARLPTGISNSIITCANPATISGGSGINYFGIGNPPLTTEPGVQFACPVSGTISNLYARVQAPTGSETNVITLRKNGSSTALTTTITGAATTGHDTTHTVSVVAGDLLAIQTNLSGGATGGAMAVTFEITV